MIKVAVIGASGYTGGELLRLLSLHPKVKITAATSEQSAGKTVEEVFPNLKGRLSLSLRPLGLDELMDEAELFFLALPHTTAMPVAARLLEQKKRVIDLSADFRLKDPAVYASWYKTAHRHPELLAGAVYGLPEIHREAIRKARLTANPGCYPTGAILGLFPLMAAARIDPDSIIIDSKSGVSGAGRGLSLSTHFSEANEAASAYQIGTHRHTPEIEQELSVPAGKDLTVNFTPHLIPVNRGILSTIYVRTLKPIETGEAVELFQQHYKNEPFVRILPEGDLPNIRNVRGSNDCHIGLAADLRNRKHAALVVVTAIDNLMKGASGQAVQNMNIMMGFEETMGLDHPGLFP